MEKEATKKQNKDLSEEETLDNRINASLDSSINSLDKPLI